MVILELLVKNHLILFSDKHLKELLMDVQYIYNKLVITQLLQLTTWMEEVIKLLELLNLKFSQLVLILSDAIHKDKIKFYLMMGQMFI